MNFSTRSVNSTRPTRSWFWIAEKASTLATSAASSRLLRAPEPKLPDALRSTSSSRVSSRSSVNFFTKGRPGARGHVPVDGADLVAGQVLAHLLEVHAAALEDRVVLAGHGLFDQAAGPDLQAAHPAQDLARTSGVHAASLGVRGWGKRARCAQGTAMPSKMRVITSSEVTFSASAS